MKKPITDFSFLSLWEWLWLQGAPEADGEAAEPSGPEGVSVL